MAKATKESLAESRRKAKIENHLERKETIQEDDIIAYVEAMSMEGHKKKLAEDVTLKVLVGKVFEEIILESLKTLFTKKVQRKAAEEDNTLASVPGRTESKDENKSKDVSELEDGAREVGVMYVYLGAWAPMRMSGSGTSIGSTSSNVPIGKKRSVTSSQKVS